MEFLALLQERPLAGIFVLRLQQVRHWHAGCWTTGAEGPKQVRITENKPSQKATEHEIAAVQCVNVSSRSTLSNLTLDKAVGRTLIRSCLEPWILPATTHARDLFGWTLTFGSLSMLLPQSGA